MSKERPASDGCLLGIYIYIYIYIGLWRIGGCAHLLIVSLLPVHSRTLATAVQFASWPLELALAPAS